MSDIIDKLRSINPDTPYRNLLSISWDAAAVIECQASELKKQDKEIERLRAENEALRNDAERLNATITALDNHNKLLRKQLPELIPQYYCASPGCPGNHRSKHGLCVIATATFGPNLSAAMEATQPDQSKQGEVDEH